MEKTGCKIICGAPTTLAVKGLMMMMMMMTPHAKRNGASIIQDATKSDHCYELNRADKVILLRWRTGHHNRLQNAVTPVEQDVAGSWKCAPEIPLYNDQGASSPALPAPGHPAEDRLARGRASDGEAV